MSEQEFQVDEISVVPVERRVGYEVTLERGRAVAVIKDAPKEYSIRFVNGDKHTGIALSLEALYALGAIINHMRFPPPVKMTAKAEWQSVPPEKAQEPIENDDVSRETGDAP